MQNKKIKAILSRYPKQRKPLPKAYQKIYTEHYTDNRKGNTKTTSKAQKFEEWLHKQVAKLSSPELITLEIGAGTINQLNFERAGNVYDIIEPFKELYTNSPHLEKITKIYKDIDEVEKTKHYDRIISIAVLEHIADLPQLVAKICLHLNKNGVFQVAIPNEGTIMWRMGTMYTGRAFKKKYGLNYQVLMQHEHINTAKEIEIILHYFFEEVKRKVYGINKTFAFYRYYECRKPRKKTSLSFLKN